MVSTLVLRSFFALVALAALARSEGADLDSLSATFGERLHPFATSKSWAICMKSLKNVSLDTSLSNGTDFGKLINDSLKELAAAGGGSVLLGNGTFDFTAPIEVPTNTCIVGAGIGLTTLRVKDKSWPYYPFKGVLYSRKAEYTSFVGFSLDGNQGNQYDAHEYYGYGRTGIYQERTNYSYFLNVRSFDHEGSGIDVHGSDGIKTHYVAIDGTEASYNGKEGLRLDEVEYVGVSNAILSNNQGHGMASHKSAKSMKITNSQFISNGANRTWGCGLWMDGLNGTKHKDYNSANVVIEESAFRNSSRFAVCMRNVENATVANTSIINLVDSNATCYYVRNVKAFSTPDTDCNMSSGTFYIPNNDMDINRTITPIPAGPSNVECPNNGISYFDTCCPYTCEYCGKVECADRGENDECCYTETKEKAPACSTGTLPCVQQSEMAADSEMVASS